VDYWDFLRHVRPLAFPPCSLFAYTWKTLEAIASSDFYLDCLPDVEGLNRRHDLSIIIHCRRPTGTIPPLFFAWQIPFMFVSVLVFWGLVIVEDVAAGWKVSCQVSYSFQRHLTL
jgi:hypothetical protein